MIIKHLKLPIKYPQQNENKRPPHARRGLWSTKAEETEQKGRLGTSKFFETNLRGEVLTSKVGLREKKLIV